MTLHQSNFMCASCRDSAVDREDGNWCRHCCYEQRSGRDDVKPLGCHNCFGTTAEHWEDCAA